MGFFSDIFGSNSEQISRLPPYLEEFYKGQVTPRVTGMLDRQYPLYRDPRIAGFAPEEEDAFRRMTDDARTGNAWGPQISRAMQMTEEGSAGYDPTMLGKEGKYDPALIGNQPTLSKDAVDTYMSPYMDKVINPVVDRLNRQNDRASLRDRARASRTGNLYSAGHGIIDAERDAATDRNIAEATGGLLDKGYGQALGQMNVERGRQLQSDMTDAAARNRATEFLMSQGLTREQANQQVANQAAQFNRNQKLQGGRQMASLGQLNQQLRDQGWSNLQKVGAAKRGMGQQNLDLAYKDFMDQFNWPTQNLSQLVQIMNGQPYSKETTSTSTPSPFNIGAGAALIGSSLFGGKGGGFFGFADGGMVPSGLPGIRGPRGPSGPALARPLKPAKRRATQTPGRQDWGDTSALPPPGLNARMPAPSFA